MYNSLLKNLNHFEYSKEKNLARDSEVKNTNLLLRNYSLVNFLKSTSSREDIRVKSFECILLESVDKRMKVKNIHLIATYLTPIFRDSAIILDNDWNKIKSILKNKLSISNTSQIKQSVEPPLSNFDFFSEFININRTNNKLYPIKEYDQFKFRNEDYNNEIKFWKENSFGSLNNLAINILQMPITSTERIFSNTKFTMSKQRNR